jgi:tagaturonate reductase
MSTKILQFGTGVFLRGFFGSMIHDMNQTESLEASITMVKLTPNGDMQRFIDSEGRYDLIIRGLENGNTVDEVKHVDLFEEFIHPYQQWSRFLESAQDADVDVVISNSTEAGIVYKECAKPSICPESYPAKLCAWLYERFTCFSGDANKAPLVLPMELIANNGGQLKNIVMQHATDWELSKDFLSWLHDDCDFRNTLVDRIVTRGEGNAICVEPYLLFAIEGEPAEEILPFQKTGLNVYWTQNLAAFRETKVRMLNGGHTSMIYAAILSGETIVADALNNTEIDAFLRSVLVDEVLPTLEAKGGEYQELIDYAEAVIERFKNPFLNHEMINIALNSASKLLVRIMPTFDDLVNQNHAYPTKLTQAIAAFFWFYRGQVIEDKFHGSSEGISYEFGDDAEAMKAIAACDSSSSEAFAKSILKCSAWKGAFDKHQDFSDVLAAHFDLFEKNTLKQTLFKQNDLANV